jgi:phage repressor protein C with HTH and peptisase S24 domain
MEGVGIKDGCMALINPNAEFFNGNVAYVEWLGARSVKGLIEHMDAHIELRSANTNYQAISISPEDAQSENFRIIGKVVRWVNQGTPGNVL